MKRVIVLLLAVALTKVNLDPISVLGESSKASNLRPEDPTSTNASSPPALKEQTSQQKPSALPEVVVVGQDLISPSPEQAHETLSQFPGGTNYISATEYQRTRGSSWQDVLGFQPGVYAQEPDVGHTAIRLSIRGSGISRPNWGFFGVSILQDGLPWNFADGTAVHPFADIDPLAMQYVEVYRGANALAYGSSTLGGAINFITQTGYSSPPFTARYETGSFDYQLGHIAGGTVEGPVDAYASLTGLHYDGFRGHSESDAINLTTNVGYRMSEDAENRLFYSYVLLRDYLPGPLTLAQTESNPEQANPIWFKMNLRRHQDFSRLADLATIRLDPDQELRLGVYWLESQLYHPIFTFLHTSWNDFGAVVQYRGSGELFGHSDRWVVGLLPQGEFRGETDFQMFFGRPDQGPLNANSFAVAANVPLYGENRFSLTDELTLVTGLQLAWAYRSDEAFTFLPSPPSRFTGSASSSKDYYGVNPKVGILWEFEPKKYLYANFSRSFEPPTFTDLVPAAALLPPGEALFPLSAQRASTAEIGTRGSFDSIRWDIDFYHSWVDDELLIYFPNPKFPTISQTINATPTHHMGVEAALDLWLWKGILTAQSDREATLPVSYPQEGIFFFGTSDGILLRQVYTWSRFSFDHDPVYHDNTLPVIPEHFYQAELLYTHPSGFYIGPNVTVSSKVWTDFANTLAAPGWAILGFRMGVQRAKGPSFFFEGRNLTNQRYAATVNPIVTAQGKDQPVFLPGSGWALYGGVQWAF